MALWPTLLLVAIVIRTKSGHPQVTMAATCRNPDCDSRPWWGGWCRLCWQVTGVGDQEAAKRRAAEEAEREAVIEADRQRAKDQLLELGDEGLLAWWEVSERLNARGMRINGRPFTPAVARGTYLTMTADQWE